MYDNFMLLILRTYDRVIDNFFVEISNKFGPHETVFL